MVKEVILRATRSSAGRHPDDTSRLCSGTATASQPYSMAVATQIVTPPEGRLHHNAHASLVWIRQVVLRSNRWRLRRRATAHSEMELGLGHAAIILKPFEEHELDSYLEQGPPQRKFSLHWNSARSSTPCDAE